MQSRMDIGYTRHRTKTSKHNTES